MKLFFLICFIACAGNLILAQTITRVGNTNDVNTNHQQGFLLMGGGGDNMDGLSWFYNLTNVGDVVIIRHNTGTGYNSDFSSSIMNSITTIESINSVDAANNSEVETIIRNAEAVFLAGGNQWNYYNLWKGTKLHDALMYLIHEKKGAIGGTSAGLAVLGEFLFTAQNNTVFSSEALSNPYNFRMTIADDFLDIPILESTITDSHFNRLENNQTENRHGRLFTFLARIAKDWNRNPSKGIGVNEYTAVCVDSEGIAYVYGNPSYDDYAYFLKSQDCQPENCVSGESLTWNCNQQAVMVYKVKGKKTSPNSFDLNSWGAGSGGEWEFWWAEGGTLHKSPLSSATINTINSIRVYPNPASSKLFIHNYDNTPMSIEFWSITGQLVLSKGIITPNEPIDISALAKGVYIIKVNNNDSFSCHRIFVTD